MLNEQVTVLSGYGHIRFEMSVAFQAERVVLLRGIHRSLGTESTPLAQPELGSGKANERGEI